MLHTPYHIKTVPHMSLYHMHTVPHNTIPYPTSHNITSYHLPLSTKGDAGARAGGTDGVRPVRGRGGSGRPGGVPAEVGVGVGLGGLAGGVSGVF